jgi:endonuclease/exonuclease/phosphatase family metal-dependent hydrolase
MTGLLSKAATKITTFKKSVVIMLRLAYGSGVPRERNGQREIRRLEHAWLAMLLFLLGVALVSVVRGEQSAVFVHYNLENYIVMDRRENGQLVHSPKPEKEMGPLLRIIREIHPDLLGVAEMGSPGQFESFRQRLAQEGITFVDAEYVSGPDPDRHIALLSRFPIISRHSEANVPIYLPNVTESVRRGILDVTVRISTDFELRLIGAHLKSKLPIPEGEELVRRQEAQELRNHIDRVMKEAPEVPLLVYGDLNDTKEQPAIQEVLGDRQSPTHLTDLWLSDYTGDHWTYYQKFTDTYARIDYILTNRSLLPAIDRKHCYVFRSVDWNQASDHRPIVATIRVPEQPVGLEIGERGR